MKPELLDTLFQAIFEHPAIGATINDHQNRFLRVNKKFSEMLGYEVNEMLGKTPMDFTFNADRGLTNSFHKNLFEYKAEAANGEYEKRYVRKDGSIFWGRVIARQVPHPTNAKELITLALIEDMTPVKNDQARAEFDQMQLNTILNTSKMGIWCVDIDWKITYSNKALCDMLGYSKEKLLTLSLNEITHPEDLVDTNVRFGPTRPGQSYQANRRYLKADGSYLWTHLNVSKFPENDSKLYGLAIVEDISKQKDSELLIEQQQIKIISSAKMAALGEMASGIAHEINNPLAVIIGKLSQINRKLDPSDSKLMEVKNELVKVQETAQRIASIVKGLRAFSRDADNDPWVQVTLSSIIDDVLTLTNEKIKSEGVNLKINVESNLIVNARPTQLVQVIINLISNSLDAISLLDQKWIQVDATDNGKNIVISVTDSGAGIAPEVARKVMQPFFTTKEIGSGTGLGLSISTGIVGMHKGTLFYDSSCKNTRFTILLPIVTQTQKKSAS